MPLSVISFLLLVFQIFHSGGDRNHAHKTNPLCVAHHGFTFRKSCVIRNFVYAIGADELEDAEHGSTEIATPVFSGLVNTTAKIGSSAVLPAGNRNEITSKLAGRQLFLIHCNFRV